jgi:hypothetical protein
MAAKDHPQRIILNVSLDGRNDAVVGVFVNARRFDIYFRPTDKPRIRQD